MSRIAYHIYHIFVYAFVLDITNTTSHLYHSYSVEIDTYRYAFRCISYTSLFSYVVHSLLEPGKLADLLFP